MEIKVKLLSNLGVLPKKSHIADAGFDMVATSKKITEKYIEYGTDVSMRIPNGYVGMIFPRSSVTKKDLMLKNAVGIIDSEFLGEISFRFQTTVSFDIEDDQPFIHQTQFNRYDVGDKIGQIIIIKLPTIEMVETDDLEDSERGTGSYGSTDK